MTDGIVVHKPIGGDGVYRVHWDPMGTGGLALGYVERGGSDFWSRAAWFVHGVPAPMISGGVCGRSRKRYGFKTQADAVAYLAQMKSGEIVKSLG